MALVTRKCIEDIKRKVNIYDVVSPAVALKPSGKNFVGLSPFSNEKTPSFFVLPEKNIFKCWSSGHAGDIFRFISLQEKLPFNEAIEAIANRFNLTLEYEHGGGEPRVSRSLRKEILEIHEQAADYYHRVFKSSTDVGSWIRRYWQEDRNFSIELGEAFKVGLAPPSGSGLIKRLDKVGFSLPALRECGLFYARDHDSDLHRFRPRFRGRLMIPIRDYQGQIVAFTARQLELTPENDPAREAKYINSPETPVFHKSSLVFGLDRARKHIDDSGFFVLVEGQIDAIRCWDVGIKTAVAPQGTAVTEAQLALLKRYSGQIECLLDGDSAGQKAALRMLPIALKAGHEVRFLVLPEGADPDSVLAEGGLKAFQRLREEAQSAIQFATGAVLPKGAKNASAGEKGEAMKALFEIIAAAELQVVRDEFLREAAGCLQLNAQSVTEDFRRFIYRKSTRRASSAPSIPHNGEQETDGGRLTTAEYEILLLVFHYTWLGESIAKAIDTDWIETDTLYGRILSRVLAEFQECLWDDAHSVDHLLETEDEKDAVYTILAGEPDFEDPVKEANKCVCSLLSRHIKSLSLKIETRIANLPTPSDEFPALQRQLIELRQMKGQPPQIKLT